MSRKLCPRSLVVAACILGLAGIIGLSGIARAQHGAKAPQAHEGQHAEAKREQGWQFTLGTYLWTTALRGDVTLRDQDIHVDASFIDIVKNTNSLIALDVLFVARKGRWGFLVDPLYMKIGTSGQGPLGVANFDLTARIVIAEATGFYTFLEKSRPRAGQTTVSIDAILGLRTWWIGLEGEVSDTSLSNKSGQAWVDPLAGLVFRFDLAHGHVPIVVRGDFGGWGVGSSIAWAATAAVGYRWMLRRLDIGIDLAYRSLGPNYSNDSKGFGWDVVMHGPALAVIFGF